MACTIIFSKSNGSTYVLLCRFRIETFECVSSRAAICHLPSALEMIHYQCYRLRSYHAYTIPPPVARRSSGGPRWVSLRRALLRPSLRRRPGRDVVHPACPPASAFRRALRPSLQLTASAVALAGMSTTLSARPPRRVIPPLPPALCHRPPPSRRSSLVDVPVRLTHRYPSRASSSEDDRRTAASDIKGPGRNRM